MAESRPLYPGWPVRIIIAASLALLVVVRLLQRLDDRPWPLQDAAVGNILTWVFSFIALLTAWIWFSFLSGFPLLVRRVVMIAALLPVVLLAPLVGIFRLEEVSGSMVPRFVLRWSAVHDRQLGKVETPPETQAIDLATATPDDFPEFLGPQRSCWIEGPELARDWSSQPPKLVWKQSIGAGWSAFSAVNGYAVTLEQRGDDEWVTCYEIATGQPVWGHAAKARHENPMGGIGPRSTPTIRDGRVYALGATGILRCLDGATGKLLWKDDLQTRYGLAQWQDERMVQWGRSASPLIVDDLVVVPGGGPAGKAKNLVAFRAETGEVVWESENRQPNGTADQIAYASPALATLAGRRQIVIVNESTASGHDPASGQRLWTHDWPGSSSSTASSSQAVPIDDDRLLLSKGYGGGAELLHFPSAAEGQPSKPVEMWKNRAALQTKFTNVVVYRDHIYGLSEGILECVESATGRRKWKSGRYGHGQILGVGDLLLVLAEDGRLALVEANPQAFAELASIQALEGKTWNNLCLYGRQLLIRNGREAACYELP
jgi:outer membrane protein assembly factor BamB